MAVAATRADGRQREADQPADVDGPIHQRSMTRQRVQCACATRQSAGWRRGERRGEESSGDTEHGGWGSERTDAERRRCSSIARPLEAEGVMIRSEHCDASGWSVCSVRSDLTRPALACAPPSHCPVACPSLPSPPPPSSPCPSQSPPLRCRCRLASAHPPTCRCSCPAARRSMIQLQLHAHVARCQRSPSPENQAAGRTGTKLELRGTFSPEDAHGRLNGQKNKGEKIWGEIFNDSTRTSTADRLAR